MLFNGTLSRLMLLINIKGLINLPVFFQEGFSMSYLPPQSCLGIYRYEQ